MGLADARNRPDVEDVVHNSASKTTVNKCAKMAFEHILLHRQRISLRRSVRRRAIAAGRDAIFVAPVSLLLPLSHRASVQTTEQFRTSFTDAEIPKSGHGSDIK
jgi:hypothetical protein